MALPQCPHCNGRHFALTTIEPIGSRYKTNLIHCNGCGAPVGAMEYYDAGALLKKMQATLEDLEKRIRRLGG